MKFPILTFSISIVVAALYTMFGNTPQDLIWISDNVAHSPWSLITAHLVHISIEHLVWNLAALIILSSIIEQTSKRDLLVAIGFGMFGLNLYLLTLFQLDAYAGLSGVLNTLLVVALYNLSKQKNYRLAAAITLVASLAKIILELELSSAIFSSLPWPSVPEAHLAGWLAGVAIVSIRHVIQKLHSHKAQNSHTSFSKMQII